MAYANGKRFSLVSCPSPYLTLLIALSVFGLPFYLEFDLFVPLLRKQLRSLGMSRDLFSIEGRVRLQRQEPTLGTVENVLFTHTPATFERAVNETTWAFGGGKGKHAILSRRISRIGCIILGVVCPTRAAGVPTPVANQTAFGGAVHEDLEETCASEGLTWWTGRSGHSGAGGRTCLPPGRCGYGTRILW